MAHSACIYAAITSWFMMIFTPSWNFLLFTDQISIAVTTLMHKMCYTFSDVVKVLEDGDLQTLGLLDYDKRLKHSFTAHPKVDPFTGKLHCLNTISWFPSYFWQLLMFVFTLLSEEMFTFGYSHEPPYCTYRVITKEGAMLDPVPITISESVMMHDFAITENYSIFMDLPLLFRPKVSDIGAQKTFAFSSCTTYLHSANGCLSWFLFNAVGKYFKPVFITGSLSFYIIVYRKWWRTVSLSTSLILQRRLVLVFSHAMQRMTKSSDGLNSLIASYSIMVWRLYLSAGTLNVWHF